ncbi:MAG: NADAR family protein [Candidatus Paceibacterota bacterium]|nr:MAG: NADAR family protein [Candidatus Paceibacterota bacterium]
MYPKSNKDLNKETDNAVYFFTPAFHPLDNFSAHVINIWDKEFSTAEHAFQWKKFSETDAEIADKILEAKSPHLVKEISDANKSNQPSDWHDRKVSVMEEILKAKAEQHKDVREILKKTGNKEIIENSPVDNFWGIGPEGDGENMVGKIWMKIRDDFK